VRTTRFTGAASISVFATGEDYKVYRCSIH
jgi:hypothetical protein